MLLSLSAPRSCLAQAFRSACFSLLRFDRVDAKGVSRILAGVPGKDSRWGIEGWGMIWDCSLSSPLTYRTDGKSVKRSVVIGESGRGTDANDMITPTTKGRCLWERLGRCLTSKLVEFKISLVAFTRLLLTLSDCQFCVLSNRFEGGRRVSTRNACYIAW
jgi:hypothetical protein